jgi:hypothetical protein
VHAFGELRMQHAVEHVPALSALLAFAYLTFHLAVTAGVLLWLHQRRPAAFPVARTALLLASGIALIGFLLYPTAPPRLAGVGVADLNHGLISWLYNPYAAVPSMHIGYAVVVGGSLLCCSRSRFVRVLGLLYPLFVLLVVVATGNHFFFDAVVGGGVAGIAALAAARLTRPTPPSRLELAEPRREAGGARRELAA